MAGILPSKPSCSRFDSQHSQKLLRGKIVDVAGANQWRRLEESGEWLENVDPTILVLACGKQVPDT